MEELKASLDEISADISSLEIKKSEVTAKLEALHCYLWKIQGRIGQLEKEKK